MLNVLVRVFNHDDRSVDHSADGYRYPAKRHDVCVHALIVHDDESDQHTKWQRHDCDKRRAQVKQEHQAHQRDDDEFLHQLGLQVVNSAQDQVRAVIHGHNFNAGWKTRLEFFELRLHRCNRLQSVLARAHHDHAASDLAFTIQLGNTAPHFRAELHARNIAQSHRNTSIGRQQRNLSEVIERAQIACGADHVLRLTQFQH